MTLIISQKGTFLMIFSTGCVPSHVCMRRSRWYPHHRLASLIAMAKHKPQITNSRMFPLGMSTPKIIEHVGANALIHPGDRPNRRDHSPPAMRALISWTDITWAVDAARITRVAWWTSAAGIAPKPRSG